MAWPPAWAVPALAAAVGALLFSDLGARARRTGRTHDALWALGFLGYALASVLEARAELAGWSALRYRLYFVLAPALVGFLGAGNVHLLARGREGRERLARAFTFGILGLLAAAGLGQLDVPLDAATVVSGPEGSRILAAWGADLGARAIPFPHPARVAFLLVNVLGGLALVGGSGYAAWADRDPAVGLVAAGAFLPFLGGVLGSAGVAGVRVPLQLAGAVVMYAGYRAGTETPAIEENAGG